MNLRLTILLILASNVSAFAAQYDFRPKDQGLGRFMLFNGEIMVHDKGTTSPERPEFLVWTTNASKGPARLFFDSERAKRRFLLVDETKETPRLLIKEIDTVNLPILDKKTLPETIVWSWEPINNQGDDKGSQSRLRVEKGKFKGWYLAAEPESVEVKSADGTRKFQARKLKFVEKAEDAMEFEVYVVSK